MTEQLELPFEDRDEEARTKQVVERANNKYLNKNFKISTSRTLDDPIYNEIANTPDINEIGVDDISPKDIAKNTLTVAEKLFQIKDSPIQNDQFNYPGAAADAQKNADQLKQPNSDAQIVWDNIYKNMSAAEKKNFLADEKRKKILQDVEKFDTKALEDFNNRVEKFKNREYNNYKTRVNNYRIAKTNVLIEDKRKELQPEQTKPVEVREKYSVPEESLESKINKINFENLLKKVEAEKRQREYDLNNTGIAYLGLTNGYKVKL